MLLSQMIMFFAGSPASVSPSTIASTTSGFVPLTERPVAETLMPTLSAGEIKDLQAPATDCVPVTLQTRLSTILRTTRACTERAGPIAFVSIA